MRRVPRVRQANVGHEKPHQFRGTTELVPNDPVKIDLQSRDMSGLVQIGSQPSNPSAPVCAPVRRTNAVLWLQGVTLAWMLVECGASLYAAAKAHSPALLAFGSDSFV